MFSYTAYKFYCAGFHFNAVAISGPPTKWDWESYPHRKCSLSCQVILL